MAKVIAIGQPANDSERRAIAYLRDNLPNTYTVIHSFEIRRDRESYEIDIALLAPHSLFVIDTKGTKGHIDLYGKDWQPQGRQPYASPLPKLRQNAKKLKSLIQDKFPAQRDLKNIHLHAVVLLTEPTATVQDLSGKNELDDITFLDQRCLTYFKGRAHIPSHRLSDIRTFHSAIVSAIQGKAAPKPDLPTFRDWKTIERLGVKLVGEEQDENDIKAIEYIEYRAKHILFGSRSGAVRVREYIIDPYKDTQDRDDDRRRIGNAYRALAALSPHINILGIREFFETEDRDRYILVTEDVSGNTLRQYLSNPNLTLTQNQKFTIIRDVLNGLDHAHKGEVTHRNLTPEAILISPDGRTRLTSFDYARVGKHRATTIANLITDKLDYSYQAPECDRDPNQASIASDLFSAGLIFYEMLTGDRPFNSLTELLEADGIFPLSATQRNPALHKGFDSWLQTLCAFDVEDRYTSAKVALHELRKLLLPPNASPSDPAPAASQQKPLPVDVRNLPAGYILNDQFKIQEALGFGGFGATYKVFDIEGDVERVIKLIDRDRKSVHTRFRQEYQKLTKLDHPNVVRVIHGGRFPDDTPYILMQYLEGSDVEKLITEESITLEESIKVAQQTATGLAYVHQKEIYHQDIKPANLYLTNDGIRILDFNVSVSEQDSHIKAGGTHRYVPPDFDPSQQPTSEELIDRDLYALGITLYECITGKHPFNNERPPANTIAPDPRQSFDHCSDLSAELVALLLKMIAPVRRDRFKTAEDLLSAIAALKHLRQPAPPPEPIRESTSSSLAELTSTKPNYNPFVSYLLTLYSQSQQTNAGTRGLDENSKLTYVPTLLDEALRPAILSGEFRLVIISGNAGDGKTAFIQKLEEASETIQRSLNGSSFTCNGRTFITNYDGSQDEGEKANTDVLLEFLEPFSGNNPSAWSTADTRIIAVNEGRLVDFLSEHQDHFSYLTQRIHQGLRGFDALEISDGIVVINLNLRSIVADTNGENSSIFDRLIAKLTAPKFWQACQQCDLKDRCYIHHNARTFIDTKSSPKVIQRLKKLYTLTHLRGRLHITLRDLRSTLAFTIAGTRDCDQVHRLYNQSTPEARTEILNGFYFNAWMGGEAGSRDRLLSLLSEIDMGETSDPIRDRAFAYLEPDSREMERLIGDRPTHDTALFKKVFADLPRDYSSKISRQTIQRYSSYVAMLRRRHYFEQRDQNWQSMLPYQSERNFVQLVQNSQNLEEEVRLLIAAINRGEGLRDPSQLQGSLALQVRQVERGTIRSYRLFDQDAFSLHIPQVGSSQPFLEFLPQNVLLCYKDALNQADLWINLDVYEMLMKLNQGYRPSLEEQQGIYRNLTVFKNVLAAAPYQEVLLTETGQEFYSIRRDEQGNLSMQRRVEV